ncbi:MAG: RNA polymerase sporulation sigma factor SigH [Lachnospiraceae bacterium]|nr:RNA polymerase sporulation sigma factor SigH [Lachnospiraceae bacterium]
MSKSPYQNYSDEELVAFVHDGNNGVIDYLMEKYKNLVRSQARMMYMQGADKDDLIQEGMIGLFKAIRDYDSGRDAAFKTFATLCISRQITTAVENAKRKKHTPLNSYVSLDASDDEGDSLRYETLLSLAYSSPEENVIDRERVNALNEAIRQALSPLEREVFALLLGGMNYVEIAKALKREEKSVDNAIQRIKKKIKTQVLPAFGEK